MFFRFGRVFEALVGVRGGQRCPDLAKYGLFPLILDSFWPMNNDWKYQNHHCFKLLSTKSILIQLTPTYHTLIWVHFKYLQKICSNKTVQGGHFQPMRCNDATVDYRTERKTKWQFNFLAGVQSIGWRDVVKWKQVQFWF